MNIAIAIAAGFVAGAIITGLIWKLCARLHHDDLYDAWVTQKNVTLFWRERWVDIVRRLDEQDVEDVER